MARSSSNISTHNILLGPGYLRETTASKARQTQAATEKKRSSIERSQPSANLESLPVIESVNSTPFDHSPTTLARISQMADEHQVQPNPYARQRSQSIDNTSQHTFQVVPLNMQPFDELIVNTRSNLLIDFNTMQSARTTLQRFLFRLNQTPNVSYAYYGQVIDLLTKLESRNLKWSALRYQILTSIPSTPPSELSALQNQLANTAEYRKRIEAEVRFADINDKDNTTPQRVPTLNRLIQQVLRRTVEVFRFEDQLIPRMER